MLTAKLYYSQEIYSLDKTTVCSSHLSNTLSDVAWVLARTCVFKPPHEPLRFLFLAGA